MNETTKIQVANEPEKTYNDYQINDEFMKRVDEPEESLDPYQTKEDNDLQTTSHLVVGAINELNTKKANASAVLPRPASGLVADKLFAVDSYNAETGELVLKVVDAPSGGEMKVKVAGTTLTPDANGYVNISKGASNTFGVFSVSATNGIDSYYGTLKTYACDSTIFDNRSPTSNPSSNTNAYNCRPIVANNFDYALRAAMTDGVGRAWTTVERQAALTRLGITVDSDGICHFSS